MQEVVVAKPYQFVPPHHGNFWPGIFRRLLPIHTRRNHGVEWPVFHGLGQLQASLKAGHGVLLASNHCRPCDPFVVGLIGVELGIPLYTMASWHLFMQGRLQRWVLRRAGVFSIYREGLDRETLKTSVQLLTEARRPLVVFPEGRVSRGNDRLGYLMDGVSFIARSAARARARGAPAGQVVIHPVALRYSFPGDLRRAVEPVLERIERRIGWFPYVGTSLVRRIRRLGEGLLAIKEVEYFGAAQQGSCEERVARLIDRVLRPLEDLYLNGQREPAVVLRVKKVRGAILGPLARGEVTAEEKALRWRHLSDCSFAQALDCYPPGYLDGQPTAERLLETVERFEEDLTDQARIHRPLHCRIDIGEAIPVTPDRPRGPDDPLTAELEARLKALLAASAHLSHPWKE